ncbi:MAG: glycosyltransferase, partial [Thermoanaerobaculia bacterium]
MRILLVATKVPWPSDDGGKLLIIETLRAFQGRHDVTLVAPGLDHGDLSPLRALCRLEVVPVRRSLPLGRLLRGEPMSVARHSHPEVARRATALALANPFDLVHAEQFHALDASRAAASAANLPLVLREQNVESDLWEGAMAARASLVRWPLAFEARRLARREGADLALADVTVALTPRDRDRLLALSGLPADRIVHVPVPFPARLPQPGVPLEGQPAAILLGSAGWHPNRDGQRWFLSRIWPAVQESVPGAVLHLFGEAEGPTNDRIRVHARPGDAAMAFAAGSVMVVPLR